MRLIDDPDIVRELGALAVMIAVKSFPIIIVLWWAIGGVP